MNITREEVVSTAKAKEILEARSGEAEPKYEQKNTIEILRKFTKLDVKKSDELSEELGKVGRLLDRHIVSIVDFLPADKEDLRAVLHKEYSSLTDNEIEQILNTVKKYA